MTPEEIEARMDGRLREREGGVEAVLPAATFQNHAAFLARLPDGALACAWFGGSLEGRSDISIHASLLEEGAPAWSSARRLTDSAERSEQNPVIFVAPSGEIWLFNTAQPAGNQDESQVFMRPLSREDSVIVSGEPRNTGLPAGTFVRGPVTVRDDGAWLLPLFLCNARPGERWIGAHDTAAMGVSTDGGSTWTVEDVPNSLGSVHMMPVPHEDGSMVAFYRRRQADTVHRSVSTDGGRSWSVPSPTDVPNNNSSIFAARLRDGRIAMVCNPINAEMSDARRAALYDELGEDDGRPDASGGCRPIWGVPRAPLSLCLSEDGGRTFPVRHVVEDGPGTCLSNDSLDGRNKELSYPALLPRADGGLDIAFTLHRRAIKHVRLDAAFIDALGG